MSAGQVTDRSYVLTGNLLTYLLTGKLPATNITGNLRTLAMATLLQEFNKNLKGDMQRFFTKFMKK